MEPQISGAEGVPRNGRGHFVKGQSGNPGGRTKDHREIQELARSYGPKAIMCLGRIMEDNDAPHASRVAAASIILDRAYGKPIQPTVIAAVPFEDLDDGTLLQTIMRKAAELGVDAASSPGPRVIEHQEAMQASHDDGEPNT